MCISVFYAQAIGLWVFLFALAILTQPGRYKKTILDTLSHGALVTFTGLVALGLGLVIVLSHNVWVMAWPVIVTLFGWFLIFQGVMRLFWPETLARTTKDVMARRAFPFLTWAWLLVGLYLIWMSFTA